MSWGSGGQPHGRENVNSLFADRVVANDVSTLIAGVAYGGTIGIGDIAVRFAPEAELTNGASTEAAHPRYAG